MSLEELTELRQRLRIKFKSYKAAVNNSIDSKIKLGRIEEKEELIDSHRGVYDSYNQRVASINDLRRALGDESVAEISPFRSVPSVVELSQSNEVLQESHGTNFSTELVPVISSSSIVREPSRGTKFSTEVVPVISSSSIVREPSRGADFSTELVPVI